ncbi:MAG: hypothetical protein JWN00_4666, partial [Actinomycetia bacterium]|nr:hypothetical protein [Actinomycetes bacterium]
MTPSQAPPLADTRRPVRHAKAVAHRKIMAEQPCPEC